MKSFFTEPTNDGVVPADGLVKDGGLRLPHGNTVYGIILMYDAENGIILIANSVPIHHNWHNAANMQPNDRHRLPSTNKTFEIKLGGIEPGNIVQPKERVSTSRKRIFTNAVILLSRENFIVGGQIQGEPFYNKTWLEVPEILSQIFACLLYHLPYQQCFLICNTLPLCILATIYRLSGSDNPSSSTYLAVLTPS